MPHALRSVAVVDERVVELSMFRGFDDDLAGQITQVSTCIRGLLTYTCPAVKRVIGLRRDYLAMLDLLQRYPSPATTGAAGEKRLGSRFLKNAPLKAASGQRRSLPRSASRP
jgi:hypothetical protein